MAWQIAMMFSPTFVRLVGSYNMPLEADDVVKVRESHPATQMAERKGQRGKVVGQMHMVTVQFEDGSVETFNREELSMRLPGQDSEGNEPWKQG